jgi:hypothetical protein
LQERRAAVRNLTNKVSGWGYTGYSIQRGKFPRKFDVDIQRYRNLDDLEADFEGLRNFDLERSFWDPLVRTCA